jgi:RNA polymerase-binding transcription factor DksA
MTKKTSDKLSLSKSVVMFPAKLLFPVKEFLLDRLRQLRKTTKVMTKEDPFKNKGRLENNASPDSDAEEQFGHARVSAIKDELSKKAVQIKKALQRINKGKYGICEDCGKMIDTDRLAIFPEATLCISCEKKRER